MPLLVGRADGGAHVVPTKAEAGMPETGGRQKLFVLVGRRSVLRVWGRCDAEEATASSGDGVMTAPTRTCEDPKCGDDIPTGQRRFRCSNCGLLVCGWCFNHVHAVAMEGDA